MLNNNMSISLIRQEDMNNEICIGDESRGFSIIKGTQGIIPTETMKFISNVNKFHNKLDDLSINSEEEGILRSEQLKKINGVDVELEKYIKKTLKPVKDLEEEIMSAFRPVLQKNADKKAIIKGTIVNWTQKAKQRIEEDRAIKEKAARELEATRKKQKEKEILDAQREWEKSEQERLDKIKERQTAERERIEKERQITSIQNKIEKIKNNKEELDQEEVNKTLGELKDATDEYKKIEVEIIKTKEIVRAASNDALIAKGTVQLLKQEKEAIIIAPEPVIELIKVDGVNVATYNKWKVDNIDIVPDEWVNRVINKEKVNKAFKLDPELEIPGILRYEEQIVRASPSCPAPYVLHHM